MVIHFFQHAPGEGPGEIANWASSNGYQLTGTHWYKGDPSPDPAAIDFLVVLGGGMNIYEHRNYPWLAPEKKLIAEVIRRGKPVLGICLGAQLIADVSGGRVYQNPEYEIGWAPIQMLDEGCAHPVFSHFPPEFTALHWHGDTFEIPPGGTRVAITDACRNQGFVFGKNVVALQFHIEVRPEDVRSFIQGESGPLPAGRYVQSFEEILAGDCNIPAIHPLLHRMLDAMVLE